MMARLATIRCNGDVCICFSGDSNLSEIMRAVNLTHLFACLWNIVIYMHIHLKGLTWTRGCRRFVRCNFLYCSWFMVDTILIRVWKCIKSRLLVGRYQVAIRSRRPKIASLVQIIIIISTAIKMVVDAPPSPEPSTNRAHTHTRHNAAHPPNYRGAI